MKKQNIINWIKLLVYLILIFCLLICIIVFILYVMGIPLDSYYQLTCLNKNNDTPDPVLMYVNHDCDDCEFKKAGTYCQLANGTWEDITIRDAN